MHSNRTVTLAAKIGLVVAVLMFGVGPEVGTAAAGPRYPRQHNKIIRNYRPAPKVYRPPVIVRSCPAPVYVAAPRYYAPATRVYAGTPFTFVAGLNLYFSGVNIGVRFGNVAPAGYIYYDPYCGVEFPTVYAYNTYGHSCAHARVVEVVPVTYSY